MVFLTWLLTLLYSDIVKNGWRCAIPSALKHGARNAAMLATLVCLFSLHTKLRSGCWPDFGGFLTYVGYFYGYGFNMLPMVAHHPWNLVALVYGGGLLYAAIKLHAREHEPKAMNAFFLAILGCGIFAYYQGRSVTSNLIFVAWPAFLLATMLLEFMLEMPNPTKVYRTAGALGGALLCTFIFNDVETLPAAWHCFSVKVIKQLDRRRPAPVPANISFMKLHTKPGDTALVLSYQASVYNLYTQTKNPLQMPGLAEVYLTKEIDYIAATVAEEKYPIFLEQGVFRNHTEYARKVFDGMNEHYDIIAESSYGMAYCLPKHR